MTVVQRASGGGQLVTETLQIYFSL